MPTDDTAPRSVPQAMLRGYKQMCPACGEGALYRKYLKVADKCDKCGDELFHHRADDAPPYFVMMITGHVIVGGILIAERLWAPDTWVHLAVALPTLVVMSLWLLPRVKGALVGLQWALRMHGFGGVEEDLDMADATAIQHRPA